MLVTVVVPYHLINNGIRIIIRIRISAVTIAAVQCSIVVVVVVMTMAIAKIAAVIVGITSAAVQLVLQII